MCLFLAEPSSQPEHMQTPRDPMRVLQEAASALFRRFSEASNLSDTASQQPAAAPPEGQAEAAMRPPPPQQPLPSQSSGGDGTQRQRSPGPPSGGQRASHLYLQVSSSEYSNMWKSFHYWRRQQHRLRNIVLSWYKWTVLVEGD
jgi:hypothetical protein